MSLLFLMSELICTAISTFRVNMSFVLLLLCLLRVDLYFCFYI